MLLVDDDSAYAAELVHYLQKRNIQAVVAHDTTTAHCLLNHEEFEVVLLDAMLPTESGFEFLPRIRAISDVPIIMVTALACESDRISGLELGADDYITKPFSANELVARINAMHRRRGIDKNQHTPLHLDDLELYPGQYKVNVDGHGVTLTAVECRILQLLMTSATQPISRQNLHTFALFREESPLDRSLDVHISNLRRKLGPHPSKGSRIKAIRGIGYTLAI